MKYKISQYAKKYNVTIRTVWNWIYSNKLQTERTSTNRILIIEDEYPLADAISETLQREKFFVKICSNGEKGEDEALTGTYDLILLDVMLPGKDGFSILKTSREEKNETPVIMLTAKSEIYDKRRF